MQNGVLFVLFTQSWFKCRSQCQRSLSLCTVFDRCWFTIQNAVDFACVLCSDVPRSSDWRSTSETVLHWPGSASRTAGRTVDRHHRSPGALQDSPIHATGCGDRWSQQVVFMICLDCN